MYVAPAKWRFWVNIFLKHVSIFFFVRFLLLLFTTILLHSCIWSTGTAELWTKHKKILQLHLKIFKAQNMKVSLVFKTYSTTYISSKITPLLNDKTRYVRVRQKLKTKSHFWLSTTGESCYLTYVTYCSKCDKLHLW